MVKRRAFLRATAGAAAAVALPSITRAQSFPIRPVKLIVPWQPGFATDLVLRAVAQVVERSLGQSMVIENKAGATGTLGAAAMVSARPDGYSVTQIPVGVFRLPHMEKVSFDPLKDLTYIICMTGYTYGVTVRADSPFKTFKDVLDWAADNPGKLTYGTSGVAGQPHFTMAEIALNLRLNVLHVPFKSAADNMQALLGGHTMVLADASGFAPQVEDGRVRLLVTWGAERTKRWPTVPTLKELGYGIVSDGPWGIAGPGGMHPGVVKILHDVFRKSLDDENVRQTLARLDQPIIYMNSAEYADFAGKQFERERVIVEKLGLRSST